MTINQQYTCPACGFLTFSDPPGSYDICPVCGWEDDHVQLMHPLMRGGANGCSLQEAQHDALKEFPIELEESGEYRRDQEWRPLSEQEVESAGEAPRSGLEYFQAAAEEAPSYYWRRDE